MTTRYRAVKKMGGTHGIYLSPFDLQDLKIKVGDMIDISECVIMSKELYEMKMKKDIIKEDEEGQMNNLNKLKENETNGE